MFAAGHIFLPTDFSECAAYAMRYGIAFAKQFGATLHFGHVIDSSLFTVGGSQGVWMTDEDADEVRQTMMDHAKGHLDALVEKALAAGVKAEKHIEEGAPAHRIVKMAEEYSCDLIVISTHGRSGIDHFLFGSKAEHVVREANVPVLCVKHPEGEFVEDDYEIGIKKVLFPTDFSPFSEEVLPYAVSLAQKYRAKLIVCYVNELAVMLPEYLPEVAMSTSMDLAGTAEENLKELCGRITDVEVESEFRAGVAHREIVAVQQEKDVDVIVMPTHGRTGLAHVVFGSVAERIVRRATCPVLTVRPEKLRQSKA